MVDLSVRTMNVGFVCPECTLPFNMDVPESTVREIERGAQHPLCETCDRIKPTRPEVDVPIEVDGELPRLFGQVGTLRIAGHELVCVVTAYSVRRGQQDRPELEVTVVGQRLRRAPRVHK